MEKAYLAPQEAADYLGVPKQFLAIKRLRGGGPRYAKLGHRTVRYDRADLDAWMTASKVASTSEVPCAGS